MAALIFIIIGIGFLIFLGFYAMRTPKQEGSDKNKSGKVPKTVQDSIPYQRVYNNGIIETENGVFSKAYALEDINFSIAPEDEQKEIFLNYEKLLNSFSKDNPFQIIIHNYKADKATTLKEVRFKPQRDGLNKYRQESNNVLMEKISAGNNSLRQSKYLVVTHKDNDADHALAVMRGIDQDVRKAIQNIAPESKVTYESTEQRLETLYNIYHKDEEGTFGNAKDENGNLYIDYEALARSGMTTKDLIGPNGFQFKDNFLKIGQTYGRVLYLEKIPTYLSTDFLADLANVNAEMLISLNYQPIDSTQALKMIKNQLLNINAQMAASQKTALREGYSSDLVSPELKASQDATKDLMHDVVSRDQKMFNLTLVITVFADTQEELLEVIRQINTVTNQHQCPMRTLLFQQEDGFNACLPLGVNKLSISKLMTTESASIFMPYTSQELHHKNGTYYGLNQITNNLIMYDRLNPKAHNYNGLIFGESGSGKSFTAKCEMMSVLLRSDKNRVYIIDPESEYHKMAKSLNGEVIELSANSKTFINPFDMDIEYSGEDDPIAMKSEYIIGMIEIMLGQGRELSAKAKSIVDRCVKDIYRGYINHIDELAQIHQLQNKPGLPPTQDKAAAPTLANLYHALREQPEEEAQNLASTIEIYTQGSLSTFAHRSNVDTTGNIVVYDIKNLGTGMKPLGLHICLNDIWNKMFENSRNGLRTWIYIDEFYLLLQNDAAASFLMQIWKRARKWKGVPTGIMQNTEDLLNSPVTRNIVNNTNFVMMLSLPKLDRANLNELLQIPQSQLAFITNSAKGHGLIYTGDTILPFNNEYPQETELYKIMQTTI